MPTKSIWNTGEVSFQVLSYWITTILGFLLLKGIITSEYNELQYTWGSKNSTEATPFWSAFFW